MRLLFLPILLLAASAWAQDTKTLRLTLPQAIRLALAKNYQIQVGTFGPEIAGHQIQRELGIFDPAFEASYLHRENSTRFPRNLDQTDVLNTGLGGLTPWGLRYDLGVDASNRRGTGSDPASRYQISPAGSLTQPLLRDFGPTANLAPVRVARKNKVISDWALRAEIIDVISKIAGTYNELYYARENLRVSRQSEALAQQLLDDNQRRTEIGTMSPLDVTTARAEVARRHKTVILADASARDNEMLIAQYVTDRLETLLDTRIEITPPPVPLLDIDSLAGIRDALESRPDYRQAILNLEKQHITLAFEKNQALPRLDLTASLSLLGVDRSATGGLGNAFNRDQTDWSAGAIFSIPIPNRTGRARIDIAKLVIAQSLVELKRLEQEIVASVDRAARAIRTARESIAASQEATRLARESLEAAEQKLRAGSATTYEVLQLQRDYSQAQLDEARARADVNESIVEFDHQSGTSLLRNQITIGN